MKKILAIFSFALALSCMTSCDWFELDNQEQYNAKVHGAFIDSKTGENVQSEHAVNSTTYSWGSYTWTVDVASGGIMGVVEEGWDSEATQNWNVKNDGSYCNNLCFAGSYRLECKDSNFFETVQSFKLKKGDNEVNFTVTPYARVKDLKVTYDAASHQIKASYSIESGDESQVKGLYEARLCIYTDRYVGTIHNNCKSNTSMSYVLNSSPEFGKTYEMYINTEDTANTTTDLATEFKYKRPHYVRVAVCGVGEVTTTYPWGPYWPQTTISGANSSSKRYNYSPVFKIDEDGTVSEVTDW